MTRSCSFFMVKGRMYASQRVEKPGPGNVSAFTEGWSEAYIPFSINSGTGWFANKPHQIVGMGWDNGSSKEPVDNGYFPFSRRVIRREYLGGVNFAYVWPPFPRGGETPDPPNDEAFLNDYSHFTVNSISLRETAFFPLVSEGSSLNAGQLPHVGPHKEIYRTAEKVYNRGKVHCLGASINRGFTDNGFTTPAAEKWPIRRGNFINTHAGTPGTYSRHRMGYGAL